MPTVMLRPPRPITQAERNELTMLKDRLVVMAICRFTSDTNWEFTPEFFERGNWVEYNDGCEVFKFDGVELFLLHELSYDLSDGKYKRRYEWLIDPKDYTYTPAEADDDEQT